jgi:hypothetical protein
VGAASRGAKQGESRHREKKTISNSLGFQSVSLSVFLNEGMRGRWVSIGHSFYVGDRGREEIRRSDGMRRPDRKKESGDRMHSTTSQR